MRVICAWCQRQGRTGFLGDREPLDDISITHGICPEHYEAVLAMLPAPTMHGVEMLVVVRHGEEGLFHYLTGSFTGLKAVRVIMDRRWRERRQPSDHVRPERRLGQRRARSGRVFAMGYRIVRFSS